MGYNDYMDAVYRRMNAALRAKLMDPMELNLDAKDERKLKKKNKKDSAKRVTREADEETMDAEEVDDEDEVEVEVDAEVDRMGELETEKKKKTNKRKNGKNKKKERKDDEDGEMEEAKKKKRKVSDEGKARGSLSGIATLRRSGSVEITEEDDHKIISSEFTVGPLQLEVSKSFGEGKERQVKTA